MRRTTVGATLILVAVMATASPSMAGPSPTDGQASAGGGIGPIHITAPFALGEVDLSSLGVSPTELATVGPTLSSPTTAGNLIVDNDLLDCPNAQFTTIQSAVTAAGPGDKIRVCRGVYVEQVTIPAGKDDLTLFSAPDLQAVIQAPPVMVDPKAIVRVSGAQNATIRHFTITGPGGGGCDSLRYGVRVDNGGSALITDNHITRIRDLGFSGCQNGHGVNVGRRLIDGPTSGSATVVHNLIDNYQKGGVFVDNAGSSAEVAYNEVVGIGPTASIAQNGIQVSREASGDVHHNKVSQNVYSPPGTEASGMLLFSNPTVRAHHNQVSLNEDGIGIFQVFNGGVEVSYNNVRSNVDDGIVVFDNSSENLIAHNKAYENGGFDCYDDSVGPYNPPALVANMWVKDLGRTEFRPGICKQAGPQ
jgi:parallel beta-helix repeat protein